METIRCSSCTRRVSVDDAVCLFCGADWRAPSGVKRAARFAVRAGGALAIASAVVLAPVLLGACGCGGCGVPPEQGRDAGPPTQGDGGCGARPDAGPTGDAGPHTQR